MRRCRDERAPARERKRGGARKQPSWFPVPLPPVQIPTPYRAPPRRAGSRRRAGRWLLEPLRLQDPASPCLPRPRVPPPVSPLLRSEGQRVSRAAQPGLPPAGETPAPHRRTPCSPWSLRPRAGGEHGP